MNRSIILALAFVALVYSQQTTFTVTPLTAGTAATGSLAITTAANGLTANVYSFFVPSNVPSFDLTLTNTNSANCYMSFFLRDEAPACSDDNAGDSQCEYGYEISATGSTPSTTTIDLTDSSYLFNYVQNKTIYISATRYYSSDYDEACAYSVLVALPATTCPAGQVSYYQDGSFVCQPLNIIGFNTPITALTAQGVDALYKVSIPSASIGTVYVTGQFNESLTIYTRQYATPSSSQYACSYTYFNLTGDMYQYGLACPTPRIGDYYIVFVTDSDENVNGTFTVSYDNCNGTTGGYKCNFPVAALPTAATTVTFHSNDSLEVTGYSWVYYYFDLPAFATSAGGAKTITATDSTGTGTYMYIRRGGFPEDSDNYGYEYSGAEYESISGTGSISINFFDYYVPGRMYIGFACNSATCTVAFSVNSTSSGVLTTGTTTADASTTEQTSSSVVVVFSAVLLFIASLF